METSVHFCGATKHLIISMIGSTGRDCLGILFVDRFSVQWHELEESTAAAVYGEQMSSWNEYL